MVMEGFEKYSKVKVICTKIIQNQNDIASLQELFKILDESEKSFVSALQPTVLSTFYPIIRKIAENKANYKVDEKKLIIDILKVLFEKAIVENLVLFFNIYALLLFEIYDSKTHLVLNVSEEYKLSIIECMIALANAVSFELVPTLYHKENAPKLCQMLYVCVELAKNEKLRILRIAAMECIMTIARVRNDDDLNDIVIRDRVAEVFLFFLPGIASSLRYVALEEEKVGHKVPMIALRAWGRTVALLMQDYRASDENRVNNLKDGQCSNKTKPFKHVGNDKFNLDEMKKYVQQTKRSEEWYDETDKRLQNIVEQFIKLTHHSHPKVRMELATMAALLTDSCLMTLKISAKYLIEILITLSEDEDADISLKSKQALERISERLTVEDMKCLLENLEEGFYSSMTCLPRKFNGIDEREQLAALNLLLGYINLFGKHKLEHVLLSTIHLNRLLSTLIHICEIEKSEVSLLEEYTIHDLEVSVDMRTPWKKFVHFREESIQNKLQLICISLAKVGVLQITTDYLLDVFVYDPEHRKEAVFLLNELLSGAEVNEENIILFKNIAYTYTTNTNWYLPLTVMIDEFGYEHNLSEIQSNIILVCLLVEGIGKIALALKNKFQQFLLKTLYLVLERAGSAQPLVQAAGLTALSNITVACGYCNITQLICDNIDYFSYHVERKLRKLEQNESVLDVLTIVMKYSTVDVLESTADIVKEVLMQSCDKFKERNSKAFLRVFKIFIMCLHRWMNIQVIDEPLKIKAQKQKEAEDFNVSGIKENADFSDEIMGKSAEEMFKEDMEKKEEELEQELNPSESEEYKKLEPPMYVKLTVSILNRSLHFLPSKDRTKKILALEILNEGVKVIKDFEDELLPIVHLIWSPLVGRFNPTEDHLVINLSIGLLATLACLSKDFIRSRTVKEVLPNITNILEKLASESYLKDKGSSYRYTQAFKLQMGILEKLARILTDLDVSDEHYHTVSEAVFKYLSDKQPLPLQAASTAFFKTVIHYDPNILKSKIEAWKESSLNNEYEKNVQIVSHLLES